MTNQTFGPEFFLLANFRILAKKEKKEIGTFFIYSLLKQNKSPTFK
jgi:hypothetical protein